MGVAEDSEGASVVRMSLTPGSEDVALDTVDTTSLPERIDWNIYFP